jgi:hypothetical protein
MPDKSPETNTPPYDDLARKMEELRSDPEAERWYGLKKDGSVILNEGVKLTPEPASNPKPELAPKPAPIPTRLRRALTTVLTIFKR